MALEKMCLPVSHPVTSGTAQGRVCWFIFVPGEKRLFDPGARFTVKGSFGTNPFCFFFFFIERKTDQARWEDLFAPYFGFLTLRSCGQNSARSLARSKEGPHADGGVLRRFGSPPGGAWTCWGWDRCHCTPLGGSGGGCS